MFSITVGSAAPLSRIYEVAECKTVTLKEMEARELDRTTRKVCEMAAALAHTAVAADPKAPHCGDAPIRVMEALVMDFVLWFLSSDPDRIAADTDLNDVPTLMGDMKPVLQLLSPAEAKLVRQGLCESGQLWRMVCELSPSPLMNPDAKVRTPQYDAMRMRFLKWVNDVSRELPVQASASASKAPASASRAQASASKAPLAAPLPSRSGASAIAEASRTGASASSSAPPALLLEAARQIRTMHAWQGLGGEIAVYVMPHLKGWPAGRDLKIIGSDGTPRIELAAGNAGKSTPAMRAGAAPAPVILSLDPRLGHYSAQVNGRKVPTPPGGDCFYRSVLAGLGTADRTALLLSIGADAEDPFGDEAILKLRNATADQLVADPTRFAPMLELLQFSGQTHAD